MKKNTDYEISYEKDGNSVDNITTEGTYQIILSGKGKYDGEKSLDIYVTDDIPMNDVKVSVYNNVQCTGEVITEGLIKSVKYGGNVLEEGEDYTVDYSDTINSGKRTLVITALEGSNYKGSKTVTVNIKGRSISKAKVTGITSVDFDGIGDMELDWSNIKLTYKNGGTEETLELDEDYTISYENNSKAGTAKIVFTGTGLYSGTLKKSFKINKAKINNDAYYVLENEDSLEAVSDTKKGAKPDIKLFYNGEELVENVDYKLSYKNNKTTPKKVNANKPPQVIIMGKGNYQGKLIVDFTIVSE